MSIASVSPTEPMLPSLGITRLPPNVVNPPVTTVPARVTFAPLNVAAVVVPDLIIKLPLELFKDPKVAVSSFKKIMPSSELRTISPATSSVRSPEDKSISVPSIVILSTTTPAFDVIAPVDVKVPPTVVFPATAKVPATSKSVKASTTAAPLPAPSKYMTFTDPFGIVTFDPEP